MNATVVDGLELKEADAENVGKTVFPANDPLQNSSDLNDQTSKNMKDEITKGHTTLIIFECLHVHMI